MTAQYLSICLELGTDFAERTDGQWARDTKQTNNHEQQLEQLKQAACHYLDRSLS